MFGFILFITFSIIGAQTISVVDAQTDTPIPNVNVYADSIGVITDNYGFCSLNIFKHYDQITFSLIGLFKTVAIIIWSAAMFQSFIYWIEITSFS